MALPTTITKKDAAKLLGISRVTFDRRIGADVYSWPAADLPALVAEHVAYEMAGRVEGDERELLFAARRRKLELEIQQIEGELLPANEVADAIGVMISNARARLLAIPHALAQRLRPDEPAFAYALLESEIHTALTELADRSLGASNGHG